MSTCIINYANIMSIYVPKHDLLCGIPCILGDGDRIRNAGHPLSLLELDLLGPLRHLHGEHVVQSLPQLLPDPVLGLEHAEHERVLLGLLRGEVRAHDGDPLLGSGEKTGDLVRGLHAVSGTAVTVRGVTVGAGVAQLSEGDHGDN